MHARTPLMCVCTRCTRTSSFSRARTCARACTVCTQARLERLEAEADHYRRRMVGATLRARRQRVLFLVWRGWRGLVTASKRRQGERLARMAGTIVAAAASDAPARLGVIDDHSEWWERGVSPPMRRGKPKAAPIDMASIV